MMKRFGSAVIVLAVVFSLGFHFLLFRFLGLEKKAMPQHSQRYEVTLRYYRKPPTLPEAQPNTRERREKRKKVVEEPVERKDEPVKEEQPEGSDEEPEIEEAGGEEEAQIFETVPAVEQDTGTPAEDGDSEYDEAVAVLRQRIIEKKVYPQAARRRNIEGVVRVFLSLDARGDLVELRLIQSSGSSILDNAALSLVRKVTPYEHGLGEGFSVEIPIRYSLTD